MFIMKPSISESVDIEEIKQNGLQVMAQYIINIGKNDFCYSTLYSYIRSESIRQNKREVAETFNDYIITHEKEIEAIRKNETLVRAQLFMYIAYSEIELFPIPYVVQ